MVRFLTKPFTNFWFFQEESQSIWYQDDTVFFFSSCLLITAWNNFYRQLFYVNFFLASIIIIYIFIYCSVVFLLSSDFWEKMKWDSCHCYTNGHHHLWLLLFTNNCMVITSSYPQLFHLKTLLFLFRFFIVLGLFQVWKC